ncbi:aldolase/citrate lyase family protein [uncultured Umboniibacter sp.]|uniref:HpcH/HpaI aldolase family protein n=1 Tax=uncultured Umboniibacter sp. TaxID=1798917 RepID=UPI002606C719|nr:aldolase/citrate lyase family protein [uncultured Umboniibacter sp.]
MTKTLKQRLANQEPLVGTFIKTPSMMLAEVLSRTTMDVVCLDAEHSPFDRKDIDSNIFAYRAGGMPVLVRVPSAGHEQLLNALDCGATGVVVPHVDSLAKAQDIAKACQYGDGGRGYAGSTRAANYAGNTVTQNLEHAASNTVVIAQIEDLAAFDEIEDIAAVEGIDCLFIGMMDLTVALGETTPRAPAVVELAERVCLAAKKTGKSVGIFVPSADDVAFWVERGISLFLMSSDHTFIKQGANALVEGVSKHF